MSSTKITNLTTGKHIASIDSIHLVKLQNLLRKTDQYHVLELKKDAIGALEETHFDASIIADLTDALTGNDSVLLGYAEEKPDSKWKITGTVRDLEDKALTGLRILAYDKDTAKSDDFLGCAFSDDSGSFEICYDESDFKSEKAFIDFEGNPDLYLDIFDVGSDAHKRTFTKGEANQEEHFELKISLDSETKLLRPIVGYYFVEEDRLHEEIETLKTRIIKNENDIFSHFLLGLCYIELMKSDLKKSEWVLGENRSDDDILALNAIKEFDYIIDVEANTDSPYRDGKLQSDDDDGSLVLTSETLESLKEQAEKYKEYASKLKDLAL